MAFSSFFVVEGSRCPRCRHAVGASGAGNGSGVVCVACRWDAVDPTLQSSCGSMALLDVERWVDDREVSTESGKWSSSSVSRALTEVCNPADGEVHLGQSPR